MRHAIIVIFLLVLTVQMQAVSAYPGWVEVQQPNGEIIKVRLYGDEFFHYTTTESGDVVVKNELGYYVYAEITESGELIASQTMVSVNNLRGASSDINAGSSVFKEKVLAPAAARATEKRAKMQRQKTSLRKASASAESQDRYLVLLVSFSDVQFQKSENEFRAMLNQEGYSANGAMGSVRDYYVDNSFGKFTPQFDVYSVTLSKKMAYYGENDSKGYDMHADEMIIDACREADRRYPDLDFSVYSTMEEQIVDNVYVFYAGYSEAYEGVGTDAVWPHKSHVYNDNVRLDGVRLAYYACSSELRGKAGSNMVGIGTFTHEFGHVLGLPDLYDANYEVDGQGMHLDSWSTMASGNYNNGERTPPYLSSVERDWLWYSNYNEDKYNWGGTYVWPEASNPLKTIDPISQFKAEGYGIGDDDFYVFEVRRKAGWDTFLPGEGLLVYHVDWTEDELKSWYFPDFSTPWELWNVGIPNIVGDHQCMDLLRANGAEEPLSANSFPGSQNITSIPGERLRLWNGDYLGVELKNIARNSNSGSVSFLLSEYTHSSIPSNTIDAFSPFYVQDKRIFVKDLLTEVQMDVYDISGRLSVSSLLSPGESVFVPQSGIYIVKLKDTDRMIQSKVIVR